MKFLVLEYCDCVILSPTIILSNFNPQDFPPLWFWVSPSIYTIWYMCVQVKWCLDGILDNQKESSSSIFNSILANSKTHRNHLALKMQEIHSIGNGNLFNIDGDRTMRSRQNQNHHNMSLKCPRWDSYDTKVFNYENYNLYVLSFL